MEDPTFSRSMRDEYANILLRINHRFQAEVMEITERVLSEKEPMGFGKNVSPSSYHSDKLRRSLQTKITNGEKEIILKTISYQMEKGAQLALNQANSPLKNQRGVSGQYVNEGTLRELYTINIREIQSIQQDHIKRLELLVARFIGGGTLSWNQLKKGIKALGEISDSKATMIARTEVIRAISDSQKQTLIKLGKKYWRWITAMDERVCEVCGPLEGRVVEIGKPFTIHKRQPIFNSPVHPHCRCSQVAV